MRRLPLFCKRLLLPAMLLALGACSDANRLQIHALLDARDAAINAHDLYAYSDLLSADFGEAKRIHLMAQLEDLYRRFETIEMQSYDRTIQLIDDDHARCEQSYQLKVAAGKVSRELVQRESLDLVRENGDWKILAGL